MPQTIREEIKSRLNLAEPDQYESYQSFCSAVVAGRDALPGSVLRAVFAHMVFAIMAPDPVKDAAPDLLAACKDARECSAALLRAIARAGVAEEVDACLDMKIDGFGVRMQEAIAKAEPKP